MADNPRQRLIDATLDVVRSSGVAAVSARSVAQQGDFSQALVFYHFDGVDDLLATACDVGSSAAVDAWRDRIDSVDSLMGLVDVAQQLHASQDETRDVVVLAEFLAASVHDPALADTTARCLARWTDALEPTIHRLLRASPLWEVMEPGALASLIADAFIGIELTAATRDAEATHARIATLRQLATLLDSFDELGAVTTKAVTAWLRRATDSASTPT